MLQVGAPDIPAQPALAHACEGADIAVFFARIGDQERFAPCKMAATKVVSYARTAAALGSAYGTVPHGEMIGIKQTVEAKLAAAARLQITCPLGTDLQGAPVAECDDVTVRRFPMCVPRPILAAGFSGRVALTGYLTPTGSRCYDPPNLAISGVVFAHVEDGRITGFDGDPDQVSLIERHYAHVAETFSIEPYTVHSWHAGIHAGCDAQMPADPDPDLWSNSVFGSPAFLHMHTCGTFAPGEICWMIAEPTVMADGSMVWDQGRLCL